MHNSQQFIFNREKKHKTKFNNLGKNMKKYRNCSFMTICSTLSQHHPEMHTFLISPRNAHFLNITQKWLSPPFLLRLVSIDQCKSNTLNQTKPLFPTHNSKCLDHWLHALVCITGCMHQQAFPCCNLFLVTKPVKHVHAKKFAPNVFCSQCFCCTYKSRYVWPLSFPQSLGLNLSHTLMCWYYKSQCPCSWMSYKKLAV